MNGKERKVRIGGIEIGKGAPVRVESMLKTPLADLNNVSRELEYLEKAGCELLRVAFPVRDLGCGLKKMLGMTRIPVMADVHFDYGLALAAIDSGCRSVRINPGNMADRKGLRELIGTAVKEEVVIRVGANTGSLSSRHYRVHPEDAGAALAAAVSEQVGIMESEGFDRLIISAKSPSIAETVRANLILSQRYPYPLHLGITEAGSDWWGIVRSSCGLAQILSQGVGDTIRISLTGPSDEEVRVGQAILQHMGIRRFRTDLVSCPTCGRKRVDVASLVELVSPLVEGLPKDWTVAVMGCEVNGPREAAHADFGVAGMPGGVAIFRHGRIIERCAADKASERIASILEGLSETGRRNLNGTPRGIRKLH